MTDQQTPRTVRQGDEALNIMERALFEKYTARQNEVAEKGQANTKDRGNLIGSTGCSN